MGAAVLIAIVVAFVVSASFSKKAVVVQAPLATEVLVANKILIKGDPLKAEDVTWQVWHDDISFTGLIKKSEQPDPTKLAVYGSLLLRNIESGEPVTTQSLVDAKGSFMSAMIDPGMRAVSVPVKGEAGGAGGFISPGDQVDVILAYAIKLNSAVQSAAAKFAPKYAIQVVLKNVKVLAVDQNAKDDAHDPKIAKSVTLEVDEDGAEKLALAQQLGELSLALRRLGEKDTDASQPPMVTDVNAMDVIREINQQVTDQASAQDGETTAGTFVRVYSGNSVQNVPVRETPAASQTSPQ